VRDDPAAYFQWEVAYNSCHLLMFLVNDILDYSRIESGNLKLYYDRFDPSEMVDVLVNLLGFQAQKKGLQLRAEFADTLPEFVVSDENRIKQIIINLISNANKFTFRGYITVKVAPKEYLNEGARVPLISFKVKDTGVGIKPSELGNLFNYFGKLSSTSDTINK